MEVRFCKWHGPHEHGLYGIKAPRWQCKRCVAEAVTRRNQRVKRTLVAENGGCCAVCAYRRTMVNLHFHHVEPATKSFVVNTSSGKSLAAYRAEATKCVLVCANCHGEIESGIIESPAAGSMYPTLVGPGHRHPKGTMAPRRPYEELTLPTEELT